MQVHCHQAVITFRLQPCSAAALTFEGQRGKAYVTEKQLIEKPRVVHLRKRLTARYNRNFLLLALSACSLDNMPTNTNNIHSQGLADAATNLPKGMQSKLC